MSNINLEKSLLLIDGHSHLYRSYYALPSLTNEKGELCNAIFGVINKIRQLYLKYNPSQIIIVFDSTSKNFRKNLFPEYKKNRSSMPNNLRLQIDPLLNIIKYSGIPIIVEPYVEADDVIGSLTYQALKNNNFSTIMISTNDKDMEQLVRSNVFIINSTTGKIIGPKEIKEKYHLTPNLITLFLALKGDKIDNIPGIPGIGDKTAIKLIKSFGSLEKIYDSLDKIKKSSLRNCKKIAYNLKKYKKLAFLSLKLVTIKLDLNLNLNSKMLRLSRPNFKNLKKIFNYYQFSKWNDYLNKNNWFLSNSLKCKEDKNKLISQYKNKIIVDKVIFLNWINKIKDKNIFAFFIETDTTIIQHANILSITLSINEKETIHLPFNKKETKTKNSINYVNILFFLKPLLEDKLKIKIVQDLKFNIKLLNKYNIKLLGTSFDIVLEKYILKSYLYKHNINILIHDFQNHKTNNKENKTKNLNKETSEKKYISSIKKSINIFKLHFKMFKILNKEKQTKYILENIDIPLTKVILNIEQNGVLIDKNKLKIYSKKIFQKLIHLEKEAHKIAGEFFNLSSNKQSQKILFEKLGLDTFKKTKNGNYSTNEKVLLFLSKKSSLPLIILNYRSLNKLQSTYINKLLKMQNINTGRIYTSYDQTSTSTGRLSSANPNLQNIPIRTKEGRNIRKAFIAPEGYSIVSADYSQIELRILAHLSKDQILLNAFKNDQDIHCLTAIDLFNVNDINQITKEQRQIAKTINFSLIYGMSAFGLSEKLQIPIKQSREHIKKYFNHYKGVLQYIIKIRKLALKNGFVETLIGRKLYVPNIFSNNILIRKSAERMSINAPMQGSASDIIKKAMINIYKYIKKNNISNDVKMIIQVHDELVFEVKTEKLKEISKNIKKIMESSITLDIPLKVDLGVGKNWKQAH